MLKKVLQNSALPDYNFMQEKFCWLQIEKRNNIFGKNVLSFHLNPRYFI